MSGNYFSRTSNSVENYQDPGPYIARVVGHLDPKYMGGLEVQLITKNTSGDEYLKKAQTINVRYASPFFGSTPVTGTITNSGDPTYRNTQQSYGFWAVPPDVGTKVLVMFVEGDRSKGYWFACIPDDYMNFMVPDGRAATELTTDNTPTDLQTAKLPVSEYNKSEQHEGNDPTKFKKPYNKDFTEILQVQGLLYDEVRGTTTTSARRELPSAVYGWNTPGPVDKRTNSPKHSRGTLEGQVEAPFSRLGGSSIIMDDGDDKFVRATHAGDGPPFYINKEAGEPDGDETIPQNECIRIRTRTGHQILLHNSEDLIYIANSRGTAWIELTSDGKIDIHADDSISLMTNQDFNVTAMRDINMEAGRNVNIRAAGRWSDENAYTSGGSIRSGEIFLESFYDTIINTGEGGGTVSVNTSRDWEINVQGDIKLTASGEMHLKSGDRFFQSSGSSIHQTAESSIYRKSKSNMYDLIQGIYYTQSNGPISVTSNDSIYQSAKSNFNITADSNVFVEAIGGTMNLKSTGSLALQSDVNINVTAAGLIQANASTIHQNSPGFSGSAQSAVVAPIGISGNSPSRALPASNLGKLPRLILPYVFPGATTPIPYDTIVPRAPQHEPWTHHENMDPTSFKPDQTDRERPGELPSLDRILTPDTFRKGDGRKSSVVVLGSGGIGLGQEGGGGGGEGNGYGATSGAGGSGSREGGSDYVLYDGTQPTYTIPGSPYAFSRFADGPLATITSKRKGLTAQVAEVFKDNFQGFIDELEAAGYTINILGGYRVSKTKGGAWSWHTSGAAIDINPPPKVFNQLPNGYFASGNGLTTEQSTDMPVPIVRSLIAKYGLGWGGNWPNIKDAMHFSVAAGAEQGTVTLHRNGRVPIPMHMVPLAGELYVKPDPGEKEFEDKRSPAEIKDNPLDYDKVKEDPNQPNADQFRR
jgi:hypothetical protein